MKREREQYQIVAWFPMKREPRRLAEGLSWRDAKAKLVRLQADYPKAEVFMVPGRDG